MKRYLGQRTERGARVYVEQEGKPMKRFRAFASQLVRNHSPDGFEWGYGGSGPAQLALGLLLDVLGDPDEAEELYQRFKWDVVARLDRDTFALSGAEILAWVHLERERRWEAEVRAAAAGDDQGGALLNPQQRERDHFNGRN